MTNAPFLGRRKLFMPGKDYEHSMDQYQGPKAVSKL